MVKVKINAIARTGFFSPTIRTTIETELAVRPVKGDKINFGSGNGIGDFSSGIGGGFTSGGNALRARSLAFMPASEREVSSAD